MTPTGESFSFDWNIRDYPPRFPAERAADGTLAAYPGDWHRVIPPHPDPLGLGARAIAILSKFTLTEGPFAGQPFELRPWQRDFINALIGYTDPEVGTRIYREAMMMIGRKAGKSTLLAGLGLYFLAFDREPGAQVYIAAADRDQAGIIYKYAIDMVRANRGLAGRLRIVESKKAIYHEASNSVLRALSSESYTKHGLNASAVFCDEIHAWLPGAGRELYEVLRSSQGSRSNPVMVNITTRPGTAGLGQELLDYAEGIRDGKIADARFLPVLYGAPDDADWKDPEVWKRYHPAAGDFRSASDIKEAADRAAQLPQELANFKRLYLCMKADADHGWVHLEDWDACSPGLVEWYEFEDRDVYAAVDLGEVDDLSAIALLAFCDETDQWLLRVEQFVPLAAIARRRLHTPYEVWHAKNEPGFTVTNGAIADYDLIETRLRQHADAFNLVQIGFDRYGAHSIMQNLMADSLPVVRVGQGSATLGPAVKECERMIGARRLRHGHCPVLRWNVQNAVPSTSAMGMTVLTKNKAREKIDGLIASLMAIAMATAAENPVVSVYRTERRADGLIQL